MAVFKTFVVTVLAVCGSVAIGSNVGSASDVEKAFVPITPTRVLDTRQDSSSLTHDEPYYLQVAGTSSVPADAVAVAMNITVTGPEHAGYLTVWPAGSAQPDTSNINFGADETVPNLVTIGVDSVGGISLYPYLYPQEGQLDVIVDVVGWYVAGFNPVTPFRLVDTRRELGGVTLQPGESRDVQIIGAEQLPASGVGAVALNITAVAPTEAGFLTVWPAGRNRPEASSVNFASGQTTANAAISGVGLDGKITIFNRSGNTDIIVDVSGWFSVGYSAMTPVRTLDTRQGDGVPFGPGETRSLKVIGVGAVPAEGVGAVAINITAVTPTEAGFLTVWPSGRNRPEASSVNFRIGQTVPNAVISGVGPDGTISIFNFGGETDIIVDVTGWFAKSDVDAPELRSLSLAPSTVDTSGSARTIEVQARITDDLAGNAGEGYTSSPSQIRFTSPSGNQFVDALLSGRERVSGTALDGTYRYEMTVPQFSESGFWQVSSVLLVDQVGNSQQLSADDLDAAGLPTGFTQTGEGDSEAPVLRELSLTPSSVNTSTGDRTIVVQARITDDLAGNAGEGYTSSPSQIRFTSPNGNQFVDALLSGRERVDGDADTYRYEMTVPQFSESGFWQVSSVLLVDQVGNSQQLSADDLEAARLPTGFEQTGRGDSEAPELRELTLSPLSVNTSTGDRTIVVAARITDDLAGNAGEGFTSSTSQIRFTSPSGNQFVDAALSGPRVSGTALDGTYRYEMTVPQFSELGFWQASSVLLMDQVGNTRRLSAADLRAAGLPTGFSVN